ncbi:protein kinase domain-containing protein [Paraburkholderia sp. GAS32]|uniref:protein kinase domain-containing protein n=1 Tax=Paraburkholderia sp. GAS32 TaxID=3035129 RepID=UPI003D249311
MLNLTGKVTPAGWLVGERAAFAADHTGGYFSDCYFVERDGRKAFLKALDIEKFDISQITSLIAGFQYESDLLGICKEKRLGRIVEVLESDRLERDPNAPAVLRYVPFLVFELAEGDIRSTVDVSQPVTDQWRFFVLHQTTLGLRQLHGQAIAHQDLKPSNVLRFKNGKLKLGDLGRSSLQGRAAPHDACVVPGALNYAPFEQRYGHVPADWVERRLSTDVFHLGCLVVFAFTNVCFADFVMQRLAAPYRAGNWGAPYAEVMPHVQAAMTAALVDLSADFPERFRSELMAIVQDLCCPDPSLRGRTGQPKNSKGSLLWLERYAARFDRLEKTAGVRVAANHA